jgi:hypothetical protein
MKKIALLAALVVGALALAGTAQAKEIVSLKVCGASGCNSVTDRDQLRGWEQEGNTDPASVSSPGAQGFYTVDLAFGDPEGNVMHRETAYWLVDSNLMRFKPDTQNPWWTLFPGQVSMFKTVASGVEPFTPALSKVTVKGKAVADPSSYLRLFGKLRYVTFPKGKLHLITIALRASQPNPWVSGMVLLRYDAGRRLLIRSDGYFRLPKSLGKLVMKRASLSSKSTTSGTGGGHTGLYAGLGVGGLAAVAVFAVARRKKMT